MTPPMRLAIGVATRGRPAVLAETLAELARQTRAPDRILVSHADAGDVAGLGHHPGVEFLTGPLGSAHQRNTILDAAAGCDAVLFLDDDFLAAPRYVEATLAAFAADPAIVLTTGRVLADGIHGPGLDPGEARSILAAHADAPCTEPDLAPTFNGYGCNMAVRLAPVREHALRFDERLPLYGWYEDIDFSRRLGRHGRVVRVASACGVHLGAKSGRTSGRRLGYSQVANPLYLWRKGSYPAGAALRSAGRNIAANALRSLRPEPWVDRRGRLGGNARAVLDVLRGRSRPERILDL